MIVVLEIIVALGAVIGILVYLGSKMSANVGSKATNMLHNLEERYDAYIEKQKTLLLMEKNPDSVANLLSDEALDKYADEAFTVLKPEIDALIGQINATNLSDVKISVEPRFFRNIAALSEAFFEKRRKTGQAMSEQDEAKMYLALKEAIIADLKQRVLNWKIGNM
jgi:hypothetical protein